MARIAAEAEGIRLRSRARRAMVRIALMMLALVFLLGAAVLCHIAAWFWLRQRWEPQLVALALAGFDAVLAFLLLLLAARSADSRVELEALAVRQRAVESIAGTFAMSALAGQLLRIVANFVRRGRR
ncbi:MAG TPA: hypothetical protein VL614_14320 [Acetobacteraceae bacterium]|nr:hypothetical protein [Acetobacteraceae bacterium]